MKTYVFPVELTEEEDGRWSAVCPALPGCATWAHDRVEAMRNIREAVELYVEDMIEAGEPLPNSVQVLDSAAVSITV
ncbi:MAG: type II toxin-antitoxin system HicB family antitoxin [Deltaproteobacteria bacterium]|nr:type II toxin-antitoxin system HicB family antitoxin [Deltaproteobacteria bacterium]